MASTNPQLSYGKQRADRLRRIRESLKLSRNELCQKYKHFGITASTLQSWEDVRWKGLTEKGAQKLVKAFKEEGLEVTVEWLMFGIGENPLENEEFIAPSFLNKNFQLSEDSIITQELNLFHKLNPNSIDTIITDDGMVPWLKPGDHVAGKCYFENDMEIAIGSPCILQTATGITLVRMLHSGSDTGLYTLSCANPNATVKEPIMKDIKLFSAAPIIWIRKVSIK